MKCGVTECSAAGQSLTFRPLNERRLSSAEADHRLPLGSAKSCHLGREVAPNVWIGRQVAARTLIDPAIARHGGRIVKSMGDGLLVEFASPVEAVRCTAELLLAMVTRESVVPRDRRIQFRIGINLGDVVVEDGDALGDSVNIAARLQTLADVGGICVARAVRDPD